MQALRQSAACALVIVLAATAVAQLTIDATGPIRARKREATEGHGGGVGRKLPLQVNIESNASAPDANGRTLVTFVLTNSGKGEITLPVSPHPGDLEPEDPKASYTVMRLGLGISPSRKPGVIFPGGAELYGSMAGPGTLINLAPGDSIRILALVALPEVGGSVSGPEEAFDATASLVDETIRTALGRTFSDSREIGFARSHEYTIKSLLRSRD
jgi:hypothetical protein